MPLTLNEAILAVTGGPSVNEGLFAYYGGTKTTLQDREHDWLLTKTGDRGPNNEMWFAYLDSLGYPGDLNDKQTRFWNDGGEAGTPTIIFKNFITTWAQFSPTAVGYRFSPLAGTILPDNAFAGGSIQQIACLDDDTCYVQPVGNVQFPQGLGPYLWVTGVGELSSAALTWDGFDRYAGKVDGLYAIMQSNIGLPNRIRLSMDTAGGAPVVEQLFNMTVGQDATPNYFGANPSAGYGSVSPIAMFGGSLTVCVGAWNGFDEILVFNGGTGSPQFPDIGAQPLELSFPNGGPNSGPFILSFDGTYYRLATNILAYYLNLLVGQTIPVKLKKL